MPLELRNDDFDEIQQMRHFGLLQNLDLDKLSDVREPIGMMLCSDGHQKEDIDTHFDEVWGKIDAKKYIHELKLAGLPYMAATSKLVNPCHKQNLLILDEIKKGMKLGKIAKRFIGLGHWPCGLLNEEQVTLLDAMELLHCGRNTILNTFSHTELNVSVALQIDFRTHTDHKGQNTFHFDTAAWSSYKIVKNYEPSHGLFIRQRSA